MTEFSDNERLDWLRLIRSENVGVKTFFALVSLYGTAKSALEKAPSLSRHGGRKTPITLCSPAQAEQELEQCRKIGARIIAACEPEYPQLLRKTEGYPPVITVLGDAALLNKPTIGMVGARNASTNGCRFAYRLAQDLGKEKIVVASGLARGIDTACHKGALESGTIAVVAGGIDIIYPPENKALYTAIAEKGAVIAELPFGYAPRGQHFPQRNRIIAGLSYGVVVVEATFGSGSLITARIAVSENREVFAVPGFPLDPRCQGPNHLIREGAVLTESVKDITDTIASLRHLAHGDVSELPASMFIQAKSVPPSEDMLEEMRREIIKQLGASPVSIDEIITITQASPSAVLTIVLELELAGKLERCPGNKVALLY